MNATDPLAGMTQARWDALTPQERDALRSDAGLTRALVGLEGRRVEVITPDGDARRFWVSRSTGWRPCHVEITRRGCYGGPPAYVPEGSTVRVVRGDRLR